MGRAVAIGFNSALITLNTCRRADADSGGKGNCLAADKGGVGKAGLYGLGLYLARKIAIAHGGSLNGDHLANAQGAVFSIYLPSSTDTINLREK